jgi:hypothetical protein
MNNRSSAKGPENGDPDRPRPPSVPAHFGRYRGKCTFNIDPHGKGRIMVEVNRFPGMVSNWAMPSMPYAGPGVGFFAVPPIGADVWVEFEDGQLKYPVWVGCFWGSEAEVPAKPALPTTVMLATYECTLKLSDIPLEGASLTVLPNSLRVAQEVVSISVPPSSLTMMTEEVTIVVPEATLSMVPDAFIVGVPPSELRVGAEGSNWATPNLKVESIVTIVGNTSIQGAFSVVGATTMEGVVAITGAASITGELIALNSSTVLNLVSPVVSMESAEVSITGNLSVGGPVEAGGFLPPI